MNLNSSHTETQKLLTKFHENIFSKDPRKLENALSIYLEKKDEKEFKTLIDFHKEAIVLGMKMGKDSKAKAFTIEAAQKCIDLEPDNPKWYSEIGYVYWWCQQQDLAIAMAEKALTLLPTSPNMTNSQKALVMSNLAYYYAETKRAEFSQKAKELARGAYKLNPEPGVSDTLGYVLLQFSDGVDDLKEARKYLEEALNETEEEYSLYMNKHLEQLEQAEKQITGMSG